MSGIENLLSIVMVYRIRSDEFRDLWKITINAIEGILRTADRDFELIAVDNGSGTMEYASDLATRAMVFDKLCPYIKGFKHFRIDEPAALSKAWNLGVNQADGDYILVANNDVVLHEVSWMSRMLEPFSWQNRKIGIVGIQHMSWHKAAFVEGSFFVIPSSFKEEFDLRENPEINDYPIIFDEQFTMSCEDVDFNLRVQNKGYETIQVNDPPLQPRFLQHLGHRTIQTMAGTSEDIISISHENRIRLCRKYGWDERILD